MNKYDLSDAITETVAGTQVISASNIVKKNVTSLSHIQPHACLPVGLYEGRQ